MPDITPVHLDHEPLTRRVGFAGSRLVPDVDQARFVYRPKLRLQPEFEKEIQDQKPGAPTGDSVEGGGAFGPSPAKREARVHGH